MRRWGIWTQWGVRMRSAVAAGGVVAVATMLAGGVLLVTARSILIDDVNTAASDRAGQVAAAVANNDQLTLGAALRPSARERAVVQVVNPAGQIVAASEAITQAPPISALRPAAGVRQRERRGLPIAHDDTFWIVAVGVNTTSGVQTVLVGESLDIVEDATDAILVALLVGMPLLAVVVGVATFVFVGRTLRPVEAMRRQAATITAQSLHTRLPVPTAADEVAALAATMNTMLDRIETASTAQRRFVADASHELRSPLATIHANADLLAAADLPEAPTRSVTRIHTESNRMRRLVDDLLLLARVDDHELNLRRADVDLDDLVYAERERVTVEHPRLAVHGTITPLRMTGDPDQLRRVLRNLVDNATKHAHTEVTIDLVASGTQATVTIGNDGPPIAADDRERIFNRFVRLDGSRSRQDGGTGLGLSIAREIVAGHGGTLTADTLDHGAAMLVHLPLRGVDDA